MDNIKLKEIARWAYCNGKRRGEKHIKYERLSKHINSDLREVFDYIDRLNKE